MSKESICLQKATIDKVFRASVIKLGVSLALSILSVRFTLFNGFSGWFQSGPLEKGKRNSVSTSRAAYGRGYSFMNNEEMKLSAPKVT